MGFQSLVDFILLDMLYFDIIFNMTCLSLYHDILNYNVKSMTLEMPRMDMFE